MLEVRRAGDNELCGYVEERGGEWHALTIFAGRLGTHVHRRDAEHQVLDIGLTSLAERWTLIETASGEEQVVCIQEVDPTTVALVIGYYSLPGMPTMTVNRDDLAARRWELRRRG